MGQWDAAIVDAVYQQYRTPYVLQKPIRPSYAKQDSRHSTHLNDFHALKLSIQKTEYIACCKGSDVINGISLRIGTLQLTPQWTDVSEWLQDRNPFQQFVIQK